MGVAKAINIINKAINDPHIPRPLYMLGHLVHNKNIVNAFKQKGIIVLEGETRTEMLASIESGTVIFTAHGVSDNLYQQAQLKGLHIVDATCRYVAKTHQLISLKKSQGYQVYFYGVTNHPETEGVLGLSDDIILITKESNLNEVFRSPNPKAILTTQTTMSYLDVLDLYQRLRIFIPQLELGEEVCSATRARQTAIMDYKNQIDLLIVVGDPNSNNTKMLKNVGENKAHLPTLFLENIEGLNGLNLSNYQRIGITAGASTPDVIVEEIIAGLKQAQTIFKSNLQLDDYLK
ncbi:MAG: 4-hydroxy-3-methylbut-2-enyl diphosphate reductase [Tenericutes bacterium ADurb.BinA124]|nr:MAG: 4-hydroxy-3-methylbut-2-enyl diphosphate reductase [Tenericutes bacterium ADurb.BinA124]